MKLLSTFLLLIIFIFICIRLLLYSKNYENFDNDIDDSNSNSDNVSKGLSELSNGELSGLNALNARSLEELSMSEIIKDGSINYIIAKPIKIEPIKQIKIEDVKENATMPPIIINIKIENEIKQNKDNTDYKNNRDKKKENVITQQYLKSPEYLRYGSPLGSTDNAKITKETMNIFTDQDPQAYTYMKSRYYTFPQQRYSLTEIENLPIK